MTTQEKEDNVLKDLRHAMDRHLSFFIDLVKEATMNDGYDEYEICWSVDDLRGLKSYIIERLK